MKSPNTMRNIFNVILELSYQLLSLDWVFGLLWEVISFIFFVLKLPFKTFYTLFEPILVFNNYVFDVIMGLRKRQSYWHFLNPINYCIFMLVAIGFYAGIPIIASAIFLLYYLIISTCEERLKSEYMEHYIGINLKKYYSKFNRRTI